MGAAEADKISHLVPDLLGIPHRKIWIDYDEDADVLYVNFKKPSHADDSEIDDDIDVRYEEGQVIGIIFLNPQRGEKSVDRPFSSASALSVSQRLRD